MNTFVSEEGGVLKAWKALLSAAVVTRDRVPGYEQRGQLSGRQYLDRDSYSAYI